MSTRHDPMLDAPAGAEPLSVPPRLQRAPPRRRLAKGALWLVAALTCAVLLPVIALRWLPPPTTAFMLQSPVKPVRYEWVPMARIARTAGLAVVAAEDQKFWQHQGFDLEAIEKAVEHNRKSRRKRGASTISQQTAKNLFLWPGGGYFRKGVEAGYTVLIETLWPKARILEMYLNIAEFGPGIYGIEAAAQQFFGKPAAKLSASEAARLAAVLPSPRRWSVARPGPYVQKRAQWIVAQMGYGPPRTVAEEEPPLPPELEPDLASEADRAANPEQEPEPEPGWESPMSADVGGSAADTPESTEWPQPPGPAAEPQGVPELPAPAAGDAPSTEAP